MADESAIAAAQFEAGGMDSGSCSSARPGRRSATTSGERKQMGTEAWPSWSDCDCSGEEQSGAGGGVQAEVPAQLRGVLWHLLGALWSGIWNRLRDSYSRSRDGTFHR